jgi:hypothetical protein
LKSYIGRQFQSLSIIFVCAVNTKLASLFALAFSLQVYIYIYIWSSVQLTGFNMTLPRFKQTRRVEKKTNKLLFKEERKRQEKSQSASLVGQKIE